MDEDEARNILQEAYGITKDEAERQCFGDCCLQGNEKEALLVLIYGSA